MLSLQTGLKHQYQLAPPSARLGKRGLPPLRSPLGRSPHHSSADFSKNSPPRTKIRKRVTGSPHQTRERGSHHSTIPAMSCTAGTSTAAPGLPTLPTTAVAVDTSPAATIEVNLGVMHLQTLLVQCSFDKSLYMCTAPLVTGDSLPCTQPGADCWNA